MDTKDNQFSLGLWLLRETRTAVDGLAPMHTQSAPRVLSVRREVKKEREGENIKLKLGGESGGKTGKAIGEGIEGWIWSNHIIGMYEILKQLKGTAFTGNF